MTDDTPTDYDAVVYDLDGTLVRLDVDWDDATADVRDALDAVGLDVAGCSLWGCLERAEEAGHVAAFEAALAPHERDGARRSERLPVADDLAGDGPDIDVGVCSLNCEAACHDALATHDLTAGVDTVVGRDSVATKKPDPEPLLATLDALGAHPDRALFVGDTERDEETAARAGVAFCWVDEWQSGHSCRRRA